MRPFASRLMIVLAVGLLGGLQFGGTPAHATAPAFQPRFGKISGIVPVVDASKPGTACVFGIGVAGGCTGGPLQYNNGPVMTTNKVYTVFWIPSGFSVSSNYMGLINQYFHDVAAESGKNTSTYAVQTQYSQQNPDASTTYIQNSTTFGGTAVDSNALPPLDPVNCPDALTAPNCVTDGQLQQEISKVIKANHWPVDNHNEYFMFTAKNIGTCFPATVGVGTGPVGTSASAPLCSFQYFCAYHSWYFDSTINPGQQIVYSNMPYAQETAGNPLTCDFKHYPNGDDADATINVASHEHIESITDPFQTGWIDPSGQEIGDLCNFNFGKLSGPTGAEYSQTINGHHYIMQQQYSNADNGCAQQEHPMLSLTPNLGFPTAPFRISALFYNAGDTVPFTFTSAGSSTAESLGTATADPSGRLTLMAKAPADSLPGNAAVTGTGSVSTTNDAGTTQFNVLQ